MDQNWHDQFDKTWAERPLSQSIGWKKLLAWDPAARCARILFEVRPEFCHTNGTIAQGGFVTAWLDAAMANAMIRDSNTELNIATLELKVTFIKAVPPGEVIAEGRVIRRGRRVAFLEAKLTDTAGSELLATASSTGLVIPFSH